MKIRLKKPIDNRYIFCFENKTELAQILAKLDVNGYQMVNHDFDKFFESILLTNFCQFVDKKKHLGNFALGTSTLSSLV